MGIFKNIEEAREYFLGDRFASESGMTLEEIGDGFAVAQVELNEHHRNANGGVMGGATFTLADLAFAAATNNMHRPTVAQQVSIYYMAAPKGKKLTARAELVKDGRTTCVYEVNVTDDTGRHVARFIGSGYKL